MLLLDPSHASDDMTTEIENGEHHLDMVVGVVSSGCGSLGGWNGIGCTAMTEVVSWIDEITGRNLQVSILIV